MATMRSIPLAPGANLNTVLAGAQQMLAAQGYEVIVQAYNPNSAMLTVRKNRDGFQNIIGLGLESRANIALISENMLNVNIEHEWTNKIVAIAVGWFCCLVPFITGIVGAVNQNGLAEVIFGALSAAGSYC